MQEKKRTIQQNKALHKYFTDLAQALTEHGVDQKLFIEKLQGWSVPITADFLKQIWKLKQQKMYGTNTTTKLTTTQVDEVYDTVNQFTAQEFGVSCAFPSIAELQAKYQENETLHNPSSMRCR